MECVSELFGLYTIKQHARFDQGDYQSHFMLIYAFVMFMVLEVFHRFAHFKQEPANQ